MKDEATPEQLAMARRIAAEQIGWPTYEDAAAHNHHTDEYASVALAAIIETTNRIQRLLGNCGEPCPQCWDAIERGDHLKGNQR